jgi:hypothetical protein
MNNAPAEKTRRRGDTSARADEELETGEPIEDEGHPVPAEKKIPAVRGKFGGMPLAPAEDGAAPGGQMVLATAKYLKTKPEDPRTTRKQQRAAEEAHNATGLEGKLLNGGTGVGALAMGGAALWFVIGLMNDYVFFYPPILFVIGLVAFLKGLAKGEE